METLSKSMLKRLNIMTENTPENSHALLLKHGWVHKEFPSSNSYVKTKSEYTHPNFPSHTIKTDHTDYAIHHHAHTIDKEGYHTETIKHVPHTSTENYLTKLHGE